MSSLEGVDVVEDVVLLCVKVVRNAGLWHGVDGRVDVVQKVEHVCDGR